MVLSGDEAPCSSPVQTSEESDKHQNEEFDKDNLKILKAQQQLCDNVDSTLSNGIHTEDSEVKTQENGVHETDEHDEGDGGETPKPEPDSNGFSAAEEGMTKLRNGVGKLEDEAEECGSETNHTNNRPNSVECIELEDGDGDAVGSPPAKRAKCDLDVATDEQHEQESPVPDDPQTEAATKKPELTSSEALLNKLESYVNEAIETESNVERKVLDALLGAINIQVQREPLSVRKLILEKQLVLPNTISFPPSQVVDLLIEHDPDAPLSKVVTKLFGEERPKLTEAEKRDRHLLKLSHPAPHMTKLLMDIGQDLVQESTYSDIVHAKNLPETPKNMETYKQVAQQLKPVWEALRKKNEPYKLKQYTCQLCAFKTESRVVLAVHRQTPHFDGRKHQCAMCPEYFTNENMIVQHYATQHELVALREEPIPKNPCPCCDEDFMYKGQRDQHLKTCRRDLNRVRMIMAPKSPQDVSSINQWLWEKPPIDPAILQQQQVAQRQQAEKQQRAQLAQQQQQQQQHQQQQRRNQPVNAQSSSHNAALLTAQQQQAVFILQQQRIRAAQAQAAVLSQQHKMSNIMNNPSLLAAVQQQLQRAAAAGIRTPGMGSLFGVRLPSNTLRSALMPSGSAIGNRLKSPAQTTSAQRTPSTSSVASSSHGGGNVCEICDQNVQDRDRYLTHLQLFHKQMRGKSSADMQQGAPLACSRCRDRFWTYEGLERHLVMAHGLVTSDLLTKAQKKEDGGRCKLCGKQYAFNMLQHLVTDHQVKLCSAEIMYSCDVCSFKCSSYNKLEVHLNTVHPKNPAVSAGNLTINTPARSGETGTNDEDVMILSDDSSREAASSTPRLNTSTSSASLPCSSSMTKRTTGSDDRSARAQRHTMTGELMAEGGASGKKTQRANSPHKVQSAPTSTARYNCTKCSVAFERIVDVIEHWQQNHLKPLRVTMCRIDKCEQHLSELRKKHKIHINLELPERMGRDDDTDTITLDDD